jgi:tetratricopeptide (TPR) repeat protein
MRLFRSFLSFLGAFLLCQLLGLPGAAAAKSAAQPDDPITARAKIHLEAGVAYFNDGKYADAEREMIRASELRPVPELMYNLAQCQERLGALERAVESYRAYVRGRPSAEDVADVEKHIAELTARIAEAKASPGVVPPVAGEPPPGSSTSAPPAAAQAPPVAPPEKVIFKEIIVYKEPPPKAGRSVRYVGYGLLGLVAAGLATGIAFTVANTQLEQSISEQGNNYQELFGLPIVSCPNMALQEQVVAAKAAADAMAAAPGNPTQQQQIIDQIKPSYGKASQNTCEFYRISSDNARLNITGAVVGFSIAGLATAATVGLFLYGRHLDKKQDQQLKQKPQGVPNLSWLLQPYFGPSGSGLVLSGRY